MYAKLTRDADAFWARVDKSGGADACWPWMKGRDGSGYGRLKDRYGICLRAHRLAFYLTRGIDPADRMVCHTCDNPVCCNPKHLWLGDNQLNQLDAVAKGRQRPPHGSGEENGNAKLTAMQIETIRAMITRGATNVTIGRVFGVTHQTISRIRRGRAWGKAAMQPKYASLRRG